jgi:hypothetical protein
MFAENLVAEVKRCWLVVFVVAILHGADKSFGAAFPANIRDMLVIYLLVFASVGG